MDYDDSSCSELSLSCASSPFGEDDWLEQEDEELDSQNTCETESGGIHPYQFEPYASDTESEDGELEVNDNEDRLQDSSWCTCENCTVMPTPMECICCKEIQRVQDVADEIPDLKCIIDHPGFQSICLDHYVLDVAYLQYRQQYGERPEQDNERKRYTAYRQFVRWCWHYLGKNVRVVLPSCVVSKIRSTFPDDGQIYTGFQHSAN